MSPRRSAEGAASSLDRIPELARFWRPAVAGVLLLSLWAALNYPGRPLGAVQHEKVRRGVHAALHERALRSQIEQSCHAQCDRSAELEIQELRTEGVAPGFSREGAGEVQFGLACKERVCPWRAHFSYRWTSEPDSPDSYGAAIHFAEFDPALNEYNPVDDLVRQLKL